MVQPRSYLLTATPLASSVLAPSASVALFVAAAATSIALAAALLAVAAPVTTLSIRGYN